MTYERLRLAREEKGWTIEELSRRAGIRPRTIELIDRGEFGALPPGLYGRASIRSYASAVGLDAAEMVEAVRPLLQSEGDPLGALARRCGHTLKADARTSPPEPRAAAAVMTAAAVMERPVATVAPPAPVAQRVEPPVPEITAPVLTAPVSPEPVAVFVSHAAMVDVLDEPALMPIVPAGIEAMDAPLHYDAAPQADPEISQLALTRDEEAYWEDAAALRQVDVPVPPSAEAGREWWRPAAASAIDGAMLIAIGGTLVWLTALVGATTVPVVLRAAAPGIALVFALIVSLYFVLFGGVGNGTPGGTLMRLESRPSGRTVLNAREVFGRACRAIYRDDSLVAD